VDDNTFSGSDQVIFKLSVDNGSTFPGSTTSVSASAATPTVTPIYCEILGTDSSYKKRIITWHGAIAAYVETNAAINAAAINAIRLYSNSGANFTGATYYVYGEN